MSDRVEELVALIQHHQDAYYNGEPEISDAEFDLLWDELRTLDPQNALFSQIGVDAAGQYEKRRHIIPMGSQEKAANPDAFRAWAAKVGHDEFVVQHKMDGASIELQYHDGSFTYGVTRGDGIVGDDISHNVRRMQGFVADLPGRFSGAVRGEVVMSRSVHREKYPDKANCRNAANGLMKRKDSVGAGDLTILCYDALHSEQDEFFEREASKLSWLGEAGFAVVQTRVIQTADEVIEYREQVAALRDRLEYDIDGLVVKGQSIDPDDLRRARPEKQIAFKFELQEAATTVQSVTWSESGSTYTPIAQIEPVRLAGTTVRRANLANPRLIREMGLMIGSRVAVTKRGEIIPKIERLLDNPEGVRGIELPTTCETCGTALVDEGTRLFCPNPACPKRALFRLRKWLDVLDVRDFGDVILRKLFDAGTVTEIADLYRLQVDDLAAFDRMGRTLARKILANLRRASEVSLAGFMAGFNIDNVGRLIMEKVVAAGYDTLASLREATVDDLVSIDGIGEKTAQTIVAGLEQLRDQMDAVLQTGAVRIASASGGPLHGMKFCFTGTLASMPRSHAQELVTRLGASVASSVTSDLRYLVTNNPDSGSSKNRRARELGVEIIDEPTFLALVGEDGVDRSEQHA